MSTIHSKPGILDAAAQPYIAPSSTDQGSVSEAPGRRPSTLQDGIVIDQKFRSGTPHLHPFFQPSPNAAISLSTGFGGSAKASGLFDPRNSARRYSSADLFLHSVKASNNNLEVIADGPGEQQQQAQGRDANETAKSSFNSKQNRMPPLLSPAEIRPMLIVSTAPKMSSPLSGKSIIAASSSQDDGRTAEQKRAEDSGSRAIKYSESDSECVGKVSIPVSPRGTPLTAPLITPPTWNAGGNEAAGAESPRVPSPTADCPSSCTSSVVSNCPSDASSDGTVDTEATSPEISNADGDETPVARIAVNLENTFKKASREPPRGRRRVRASTTGDERVQDRYGTPEMPRGTAKLPHIPASGLAAPRIPGQQGQVKHLPRAEKLPMSGYELLASSISSTPSSTAATSQSGRLSAFLGSQIYATRRSSAASCVTTSTSSVKSWPEESVAEVTPGVAGVGPDATASLKPIYRRFEALNHRMLLHLQDELSELEEQLHRLDTTDTQTRRLRSRILPASRRAEHLAGGELQWHKTDILGKIEYKLGQYNHVLSSFAATRDLPAPSAADVHEYRSYLATHQPITEVETRFLDTVDDLVTLAASNKDQGALAVPGISEHHLVPLASAKVSPSAAHEHLKTFRMQQRSPEVLTKDIDPETAGEDNDAVLPFPTVTPIPGTMHGNSWLTRHNRLPSIGVSSSERSLLGHSRTKSQPTASPGFTNNRRASIAYIQHQQRQEVQRRMSHAHWIPRTSPLPLSHDDEEKISTSPSLLAPQRSEAMSEFRPRSPISTEQAPSPAIRAAAGIAMERPSTVKGRLEVSSSSAHAHTMLHMVIAMAVAVLIPTLVFSAVPGFVGRISVVMLVGLSAMGSMVQSGVVGRGCDSNADMVGIAAVYAVVMAVVAGVIG